MANSERTEPAERAFQMISGLIVPYLRYGSQEAHQFVARHTPDIR
jgi:hypothetical protein